MIDDYSKIELNSNRHIRSEWSSKDQTATEIFEWCNNNCKSDWVQSSGNFYFKDERDLKWFVLKWG